MPPSRRGGAPGMPPGGQPNMQQLMKQAQKMQAQLAAAQEELAATQVEGSAGGGLVKATVTGSGELLSLVIDPQAVDPADVETLADLVVAAVRDANGNAAALQEQKLGPVAGGAGGLPGLPF
ncbi:MAG TPA: YbaB/EbfC family nucleoid-associated protein [Frankiaceae bacterium]|nr:YbaB/EbfC family nucleoid-associated protein [Frankiaceae bacterium]